MNNLNDLLSTNLDARQFFLTLPEDAQGALIQSSNSIHTVEDLQTLAERSCFYNR